MMADLPIRFVVIGEGAHARAVADRITQSPGGELVDFGPQANGRSIPDAEWLININSAHLVPASVLDRFAGRALNLHNGPLPEYAGRHVTQWAIRHGRSSFASTVHFMTSRVDAGDVVASVGYPILPTDTGLTLFRRSFREGTGLMLAILDRILRCESLPRLRQDIRRRRNYLHSEALDAAVPWDATNTEVTDFVRAGDYRPLRSPSYTATVQTRSGAVMLYRVVARGGSAGDPGTVIGHDGGPVVACGRGSVQIIEASLDGRPVDPRQWERMAPVGHGFARLRRHVVVQEQRPNLVG